MDADSLIARVTFPVAAMRRRVSFTTASVDAAGALSSAGREIGEVVEIAVSAFTSAVGAEEAGASCRPSIAGAPTVFFFSQP